MNPVPLPPAAVKVPAPRGGKLSVLGLTLTAAVTVTVAVALLPSESVAVTASVTPPVTPAK